MFLSCREAEADWLQDAAEGGACKAGCEWGLGTHPRPNRVRRLSLPASWGGNLCAAGLCSAWL